MSQTKKKHHYVPVSYLKAFADADDKLWVYRKDDPERPFQKPYDDVAFHKYYYAQPTPDGGRDTNRLEDRFSELESKWPPIVERLAAGELPNECLEDIFAFIALQRARVPAARDAVEKMLATWVMTQARQLVAEGKVPPPKGRENILDHAVVSIDPHRSIHAMAEIIRATGKVLHRLGLGILHNKTDVAFVTSDNPVVYFDPAVPDHELLPYTLQPDGAVVVLMPISPTLMLFGASWDKERFAYEGLLAADIDNVETVHLLNQNVIRFAYKAIFSRNPVDPELISRYAATSPVTKAEHVTKDGKPAIWFSHMFGARETKPKWKGKPDA